MIYRYTTAKNLREFNAELKAEGKDFHYIFTGYAWNGERKVRAYLCEDDKGCTYDDYVCIIFNYPYMQ